MEKEVRPGFSKNTLDDIELIRLAKENHAKAFERLVKKYGKTVYYLILKIVRNPDDAEDLTQEAFTKAFAALDKYDPAYAFSTWLFRIATNNSIDHIRKKKINTISIYLDQTGEDGMHLTHDVLDSGLDPNDLMLKQQRQDTLKAGMGKIPEKYKVVLDLRYFKELTYEEIAETLNIPLGTVKANLFRARELLLNALKKMEDQV